ncbi:MAG: MBOAT family protein [Flavonifractor sp.]|nr:MBOAT family protein [Flavonifractor sp.]MCI9424612.1 MBOAT family protein [Flavonifractor sp.]
MVFSSLYFLFLYLPIVLFAYYVTPLRLRNGVLLVLNLIFYAWGEPVYILIMFASIAIDYTHGMLVERCKQRGNERGARLAVASSVVFNLALLFFFKYWDFIAGSLAAVGLSFMPKLGLRLPIGISFYTFQTMSYTIDVYRGDAKVQKNIINFGTFVTLFPQLIAGPIIKYKDLGEQIDQRSHSPEQFASGVQVFVVGLAKKVLLANNLGMLWDTYKALPASQLTTAGAWLGIIAFSLQLYFDFSGYSDMAVGLGRMLGFEFMRNFNYPYISRSVTEFWRRWHISLGTWFREYMYIPLGGNRVSRPRLFFNLLVVWAATGIWHGASWNFLLWGLYFAALLILEKAVLLRVLEKLPRALQHLYAIFLAVVSWAIFAVEDLEHLGVYLKAMFGFAQGGLADGAFRYHLVSYLPVLLIAAVASTPLGVKLWKRLPERPMKLILPVLLLAGLTLSTAYLVDATYNPFLYFRF